MRRQSLALALLSFWALWTFGTSAKADFLRLLMERNDVNDAFWDTGWRVELANNGDLGKVGNVVYGLSRIDHLIRNGDRIDLDKTAWIVVSLTREIDGEFVDREGRRYYGAYYGATTYESNGKRYSLEGLLGLEEALGRPRGLAALLQLRKKLDETNHLKQLNEELPFSRKLLDDAIDELAQEADLIAIFGRKDASDFWFSHQLPYSDTFAEVFGLSLLSPGPGIDQGLFRRLFDEPFAITYLPQFHFALKDLRKVRFSGPDSEDDPLLAGRYWPVGEVNNVLNVVPEPGMMVLVLTLGLVGGVGAFVRARKIHPGGECRTVE
ncbi:MAG: hypothetical protein NZ899_09200 [Thermoguttaceae bacterium]|nr:hypothetical protein [Thermoguttaceae bacterium]MDW8079859.1 hypothetical protein [Thermoguttaceae bacterium]